MNLVEDMTGKIAITEESVWRYNCKIRSPYYFISHIYCYLREHTELLEQPDYRRLYEETLEFQINYAIENCGFKKENAERNQWIIEFFSDLQNKGKYFTKFTRVPVDKYLEYRRSVWKVEK